MELRRDAMCGEGLDGRAWRAKVAAWLHDPPEKALVLMRDPGVGHEDRTVAALLERLFPEGGGRLPEDLERVVRRADHWASAADRLQLPRAVDRKRAFLRVAFAKEPEFVHPIGKGQRLSIPEGFGELAPKALAEASTAWLGALVGSSPPGEDDPAAWRRVFLRLWRLAPEVPAGAKVPEAARFLRELGTLWRMLPADTRTPNHTIWEHLRLSSAFAGAMAGDGRPALLAVALGPVQGFIERGRSTSDLWAGSHLLSRMAWEGLKEVCETIGPDAVIFPDLYGVPIVDAWLYDAAKPRGQDADALWESVWDGIGAVWRRRRSDANPLFAATLPNRLLAVVPQDLAPRLAEAITARVRAWVQERARDAWDKLLKVAEPRAGEAVRARGVEQIEAQLSGFPEVHWASVPFPEAKADGKVGDVEPLARLLRCFHADGEPGAFLGGETWRQLQGQAQVEGLGFYEPNPGVTYPAVFEAVNAVVAAGKTLRPFEQRSDDDRHRDSLAGDAAALGGKYAEDVWDAVARRRPAWAREGERLGALGTLKRLWPALFVQEVRQFLPGDEVGEDLDRYVVSTHAMALATSLDGLLQQVRDGGTEGRERARKLVELVDRTKRDVEKTAEGRWRRHVALPQRLYHRLREEDRALGTALREAVALADFLADADDEEGRRILEAFERDWRVVLGHSPERYYALLLMDGDEMGKWLTERGGGERVPRYRDTLHSALREQLRSHAGYLDWTVAVSPAYHLALSGALTGFSTFTAPRVVEQRHLGKVLYAGGDDLMAMCTTTSLLSVMCELRAVYSGAPVPAWAEGEVEGIHQRIENGYVVEWEGGKQRMRDARVRRAMGVQATASMGVVVAHCMEPLRLVLDEARRAEQAAKADGRDAFTISLFKRGGGLTRLTAGWGFDGEGPSVLEAVDAVRRAVAGDLSRRAVYVSATWLEGFPPGPDGLGEEDYRAMVTKNLAHQLGRQGMPSGKAWDLAELLATAATGQWRRSVQRGKARPVPALLADMLTMGEFLGRATRRGGDA